MSTLLQTYYYFKGKNKTISSVLFINETHDDHNANSEGEARCYPNKAIFTVDDVEHHVDITAMSRREYNEEHSTLSSLLEDDHRKQRS